MLLVGDFSKEQLGAGEDRAAVENLKKQHKDLKYTNAKIIKKNGQTMLRIWLYTTEEYIEGDAI